MREGWKVGAVAIVDGAGAANRFLGANLFAASSAASAGDAGANARSNAGAVNSRSAREPGSARDAGASQTGALVFICRHKQAPGGRRFFAGALFPNASFPLETILDLDGLARLAIFVLKDPAVDCARVGARGRD